jgi:hypothetical protein
MNATGKQATKKGLHVEGSVGTGKTTRATEHLQSLLDNGVPAREILVFLPQRALAEPYREVATRHVGGRVDILTISGLARRMIQRFWPLVAEGAGFDDRRPPNFLTLETAQHFMSRVAVRSQGRRLSAVLTYSPGFSRGSMSNGAQSGATNEPCKGTQQAIASACWAREPCITRAPSSHPRTLGSVLSRPLRCCSPEGISRCPVLRLQNDQTLIAAIC